jgi:hypothetical protein
MDDLSVKTEGNALNGDAEEITVPFLDPHGVDARDFGQIRLPDARARVSINT